MYGDDGDGLAVLRVHLELRHAITASKLREYGYGRRLVDRLVRRGWLRQLDRGLFVDGHASLDIRWILLAHHAPGAVVSLETAASLHGLRRPDFRTIWVALRHGRHRPNLGDDSFRYHFVRRPWEPEDLEPARVPGLPGLELKRFALQRLYAELAAAERFGLAERVGRQLLLGGVTPEAVEWVLRQRGLTGPRSRCHLAQLGRSVLTSPIEEP
ncbi:MAG: Transcriptional regulator, AbiEi antitoxin N-terminal domain [Pseudomonadota bacterium]